MSDECHDACKGETGIQGIRGPVGPTGDTGDQGPQGQSVQGPRGEKGSVGMTGVRGIGCRGHTGVQGEIGLANFLDTTSFPSPAGDQPILMWDQTDEALYAASSVSAVPEWIQISAGSSQGATGINGLTGIQGDQGDKGVTGLVGLGTTGIDGIQGDTGIKGDVGNQGVTGLMGHDGETGIIGLTGHTGIQGLGLTGLQGIKGDTGIIGLQGLTGLVGLGMTGLIGLTGETGIQGLQGLTGLQCNQGETGIQGLTGILGIDGQTGIQGLQGLTGILGIDGQTGIQGLTGETGILGLQGVTGLGAEQVASEVPMDFIGTPGYTEVQAWSNGVQSAGVIDGGVITDGGSGTINISAIEGIVKTSDSTVGANVFFDTTAVTGLTLTDEVTNYVSVDYNGGTPILTVATSNTSNGHTTFNLGKVFREGTSIDIIDSGLNIYDFQKRVQQHHVEDVALEFTSGAKVTETGTLNIAISAGVLYAGLNRIVTDAIDTAVADDFEYYYYTGAAWTESDATTINNTQYNDVATGLVELNNNQYGVHWVYKGTNSSTYVIYGQDSYTLNDAQNAQPPVSLPEHVSGFGVLRAKIIIEKGATVFTEIESVEDISFSSGSAANHNELGGLQGGIADEYYHLTADEHTSITGNPTGIQGLQGVTGIQGDTGIQGLGVTGLQGIKGDRGLTGFYGLTGVYGLTGDTGDTGIQGPVGPRGLTGFYGLTGVYGLTGDQGETGIIGPAGPRGVTGFYGLTGVYGLQGVTGLQGIQGDQGDRGLTGFYGLTGVHGVTGLIGSTGVIGTKGDRGLTGFYGLTGVYGETGLQGLTGITTPVNVYTTSTATTLIPDCTSYHRYVVNALATDMTVAAPTGTPYDTQLQWFRFLSTTDVNLEWNAIYAAGGVDLPTTATDSKNVFTGVSYASDTTKWYCIAQVSEE